MANNILSSAQTPQLLAFFHLDSAAANKNAELSTSNGKKVDKAGETKKPSEIPEITSSQKDTLNNLKETVALIRRIDQKSIFTAKDIPVRSSYDGETFYRIIYERTAGEFASYNFVLLPARETKIGSWNVPEAKQGLPLKVSMKHKMFTVPGSGPIVQTIGIAGTTTTIVGALMGYEKTTEADGKLSIPTSQRSIPYAPVTAGLKYGAYAKVDEMLNTLVYPGRPVTIEIKGANNQSTEQIKKDPKTGKLNFKTEDFIKITGVVTGVRFLYVMADRCYYALDVFLTSYPNSVLQNTSFYDLDAEDLEAANQRKAEQKPTDDIDSEAIPLKTASDKPESAAPEAPETDESIIDKINAVVARAQASSDGTWTSYDLAEINTLLRKIKNSATRSKQASEVLMNFIRRKPSMDNVFANPARKLEAVQTALIQFEATQGSKELQHVLGMYILIRAGRMKTNRNFDINKVQHDADTQWAVEAIQNLTNNNLQGDPYDTFLAQVQLTPTYLPQDIYRLIELLNDILDPNIRNTKTRTLLKFIMGTPAKAEAVFNLPQTSAAVIRLAESQKEIATVFKINKNSESTGIDILALYILVFKAGSALQYKFNRKQFEYDNSTAWAANAIEAGGL